MTFKPLACPDRWYGVLVVLGLLLLSIFGATVVIGRPVDGISFLLALWIVFNLLAAVYIGYRTWARSRWSTG